MERSPSRQSDVYPQLEPYARGLLDVGDGSRVFWETCGNPSGKPAVVVHGGPGSGCSPWFRRLFDPRAYRIVLIDQRNCGRSLPHAGDTATDLSANTTQHLVGDMERVREHLGIDRWLVLGGSWGSTLGLAYAEAHPTRVSEMVLFGVTTGRHSELDWTFRGGVSRFFPEAWTALVEALPIEHRAGDVVESYARWLADPEPGSRGRAARAWCLWESATPHWPSRTGLDERFEDPAYAMAFARIVTHFVRHDLFLEDGALLRGADVLSNISGVLINGRFDLQAPAGNAWELKRAWPRAGLVLVDEAGHAADARTGREIVRATDRFAL
jgi:proline iminopeptidase